MADTAVATRRTLTPFERAAVERLPTRIACDAVDARKAVRSFVAGEHVPGAHSSHVHEMAEVMRLDGEVARESCARDYVEHVAAARKPHTYADDRHAYDQFVEAETRAILLAPFRVLAHTTVGACDSWIAELADGRVAVAVRTPARPGTRRGGCNGCDFNGINPAGVVCSFCNGEAFLDRPVTRPGRWYRAALTLDATGRALLNCALSTGGGAWAVLGDYLEAAGAIDRRKWPKPEEWPKQWRTT